MRKPLLSLLALGALTLAGCSDDLYVDEPGASGGKTELSGEFAYIRTTIALPTPGGRSQTDTDGKTNSNGAGEGDDFEYGYDTESTVRSVLLVIASENDEYLTHLVVTGLTNGATSNQPYQFTASAKIPTEVLEEAYGTTGMFAGATKENRPKVHLYAFCNFTQFLYSHFQNMKPNSKDKSWLQYEGEIIESASQPGQTPSTTSSIWSPNSFLMSNVSVYTAEFPGTLDEWDQFADSNSPLPLTTPGYLTETDAAKREALKAKPIDVERACARLDFRDASPLGDFTYPIKSDDGKAYLNVKLERMSLVNMSKKFYYLRRVSDDGTNTNATILGVEGLNNYVVDVFATEKLEGIQPATADNYFNFPLFDKTGEYYNNIGYAGSEERYGWYVSDMTDIADNQEDQWSGSSSNRYKIWRYVTENCLPGISAQQVQQSTGIIFKASIDLGEDGQVESDHVSQALIDAMTAIKDVKNKDMSQEEINHLAVIYSFHNRLYAGVADIIGAAQRDGNGGALYAAVENILKNWHLDVDTKTFKYQEPSPVASVAANVVLTPLIADEILNGNKPTDGSFDYSVGDYKIDFAYTPGTDEYKAAPEAFRDFDNARFIRDAKSVEITSFIPTNDDGEGLNYYCYYFYWNRHNDNLHNGKMGPMEFATVRNNVYKLAVTSINSLGHPRGRDRDPEPVTPGDPDEEPMNSIQVEVNVLPWVVRENNIEF